MAEVERENLYPTREQNEGMKDHLRELGAKVTFVRDGGHYAFSVEGMEPEKVAAARAYAQQFQTPEAKDAWAKDREAFQAEKQAAKEVAGERAATSTETKPEKGAEAPMSKDEQRQGEEAMRNEAQRRAANGFMAQYQDRGFRLRDPQHDQKGHDQQLDQMRAATPAQLLSVIRKTREIRDGLIEKEVQMRAEAAGLPVEQVRSMSYADQKQVGIGQDGKPVGLTGDDFKLFQQLTRGQKAIDLELKEGRGIVQKNRSNERDRSQEAQQDQGQGRDQARPAAEGTRQKERSQAQGGNSIQNDDSVDASYQMAAAAFANRGRSGR